MKEVAAGLAIGAMVAMVIAGGVVASLEVWGHDKGKSRPKHPPVSTVVRIGPDGTARTTFGDDVRNAILRDSQRFACTIMPAPTCTVGPSRPIDRPASKPPETKATLCSETFSDTSQACCTGLTSSSKARTTCGMPDPWAPGANRRVHHRKATVSAVATSP